MDYNYSDYDSSSMYSDESGLEIPNAAPIRLRPHSQASSERTNSYRFSMANLEETHEAELDAILGELSLLEQRTTANTTNVNANVVDGTTDNNMQINQSPAMAQHQTINGHIRRTHSRSNSIISGVTNASISTSSESGNGSGSDSSGPSRASRTESPDNDSAFSDTMSLLSSESSASSALCLANTNAMMGRNSLPINSNLLQCDSARAAKIHLALQKLEQASVRRLFVKAFTIDNASKSLLVDETMSCGHITRLLADKNHVQMEPHWALVEHLPDLQMERLFEDHEMLVDNLMNWSHDSKNRVLFVQRTDKVALFNTPELFLNGTPMAPGSEHDEHTRAMLLDEHFSSGNQIALEGALYVKIDTKKVWKRYHFVLRASGIYYYAKEKTKSPRDLSCLCLFADFDAYKGIGWKKKHKAPTEFTFALKAHKEAATGTKSTQRAIKMLCAEDAESLEKWITAIRVAKYDKKLLENHRGLIEDLAREELDKFSSNRSSSIGSIVSSAPSQCSANSNGVPNNNNINNNNNISNNSNNNNNNNSALQTNGRLSRASSSSSSGCLSDENNAFDSDFPTGTIKRKPAMKPNLPLTSMTRQLKEVGENLSEASNPNSPERGGTLTRRHSRRRSEESGGSNSSTLKRRPSNTARGSVESMNSSNSTPTPTAPTTPITHNVAMLTSNHVNNNNDSTDVSPISPLELMPSCMTDSMFSLPPPPDDTDTLCGSTLSLDSLPPPPSASELSDCSVLQASLPPPPPQLNDIEPMCVVKQSQQLMFATKANGTMNNNNIMALDNGIDECDRGIIDPPQPIYVSSMKSSLKAPPYKAPPSYGNGVNKAVTLPTPSVSQKSVKFADSPVLLRRKVCFEDEVIQQEQMPLSPRRSSVKDGCPAPLPPPRSEGTRLSAIASPKRLIDSQSNPPTEFLNDLQRVMRKKWQIAQKCKLEPATTPHEVFGFRDYNGGGAAMDIQETPNFYRESSNVSNWVQEHYGAVTVDSLYANLGIDPNEQCPLPLPGLKKRPPPPIPKRNTSTVLTHRT